MLLWWLIACTSRPACDDDEVYDHDAGACQPYQPGEPVQAEVWSPPPGTTWQWQLTGSIDTSPDVAMYDVDLFETPDEVLDELQAAGRVRICYFSAGSLEAFRDDVGFVSDDAVGRPLDGWPDERWLDVTHPDTLELARRRLDRAVDRGCDGVEPDNVDGYDNGTGFPISAAEQLQFDRILADEAHARGLSVGLKNDVEQLGELRDWFDWALNEECVAYDECDAYQPWLKAGKAVFHTEYADNRGELGALADAVCPARPAELSTLLKTWDLGSEFIVCP